MGNVTKASSNFEYIKDTSQLDEDFIKNYNEESNKGHFLKVDVQYTKKLHDLHNDLPHLPERMKIEKVEKLTTEYIMHTRNLKETLNRGLFSKRAHRVIKFNQNASLKPYKDLRKTQKIDFEKDFFKVDE